MILERSAVSVLLSLFLTGMYKEAMMANVTEWAELVADSGMALLRNGAETYRTNETMEYMAKALGAKRIDLFVIPSTVMVSLTNREGESATIMRKVRNRTINLDRVTRINELSRALVSGECTFEEAQHLVEVIRRERTGFSIGYSVFFAGLVGMGCGVMQNATWPEFVAAFLAGALVRVVAHIVSRVEGTRFLFEFLGAMVAALFGMLCQHLFPFISRDVVTVGGIMTLVPGVAITNAIRDIINGDNLSGLVRGLEAALTSVAIAMGVVLILTLGL